MGETIGRRLDFGRGDLLTTWFTKGCSISFAFCLGENKHQMYPLVRPALHPESGQGDHSQTIHTKSHEQSLFPLWRSRGLVCCVFCFVLVLKQSLKIQHSQEWPWFPDPPASTPRVLGFHCWPNNYIWFLWDGTQSFMNARHKPHAQPKSLQRLSTWKKMPPNHIYLVIRHKQQVVWDLAHQLWQIAQSLNISERGKPFHYKLLNCHFQPEEGHTTCNIPS